MSHRARLLHVLASAPVAAAMVVAPGSYAHAQAQAGGRPAPYVVAIDAGHGGTPDNNHPEVPFDPGVIGPTGLLEKDVTLAIAQQVEALLGAQGVRVIMTRTGDRYVDIGSRMQAAIDHRASLFVSIHMNSFPNPATGGATVLYPADPSVPFAQVMSDTLGKQLGSLGIGDDGIQLKDDLWVHATMPAITVEGAYLSNPGEEELMAQVSSRHAMAAAIVAGIDNQAPQIVTTNRAMSAWDANHRQSGSTPSAAGGAAAIIQAGGHGLRNLMLVIMMTMLVWWQRRVALPLAWRMLRVVWMPGDLAVRSLLEDAATLKRRRSARLRRHEKLNRGRRRILLERSQQLAPQRRVAVRRTAYHSVYDELRF